jgi:hypothetical protein
MSMHTGPISEARLQVLLPSSLKARLHAASQRLGVSTGELVRRVLEAHLRDSTGEPTPFPFGERPLRTGRKRGSIDHDRPEK